MTTAPDNTAKPSAPTGLAEQARLVAALHAQLRRACAPRPVECHETHISWVLVTPDDAFKLKKAVAPGFLDFSTRERRQHYCAEEVRLNRRLAPDLYLGVVPITGTADAPALGGHGPAIDHAVHMRAFAQDCLWDRLAATHALRPEWIDDLAATLHRFHAAAAVAPAASRFGTPEQVRAPMLDTLKALDGLVTDPVDRARLAELGRWESAEFGRLAPVFDRRHQEGRIRECHGDLHLRNIAQLDGRATPFDCIEFSDDFRWIDTASEIAFLAMDLKAHGLPSLAHRFIDVWLQRGGDFDAVQMLGYYSTYRSLVRARVAALRLMTLGAGQEAAAVDPAAQAVRAGVAQAHAETRQPPRALVIAHGLSGSGKSTLTQSLIEASGAIRVRADVERKRMAGLDARARNGSTPGDGLYTPAATRAVYACLNDIAARLLAAGRPVVIDAAFLLKAQRAAARQVAQAAGVPFQILDVDADLETLRARVTRRLAAGHDPSDANAAVLEAQRRSCEPLTDEERAMAFRVDTGKEPCIMDWTALRQGWMLPVGD